MRLIIIYFLLQSWSGLFAQNNIMPKGKESHLKVAEHWSLDKYVWSHSHIFSSKNSKPLINYNTIDNWISLSDYVSISPNGQYFAYSYGCGISGSRVGNPKYDTVVLQSTINNWRQTYTGSSSGLFSKDSKQYIFKNKEGLYFISLGSDDYRKVKEIWDYKVPISGLRTDENEWIAYRLTNKEVILQDLINGKEKKFSEVEGYEFDHSEKWLALQVNDDFKELIVHNLYTEAEFRFDYVDGYSFSADGSALLVKTRNPSVNAGRCCLQYIDLIENKTISISQESDSCILRSFQLDQSGKQVVFVMQSLRTPKDKIHGINAVWYWKVGMEKAVVKVNDQFAGIEAKLLVQEDVSFTSNGKYIQFYLSPHVEQRKVNPNFASVDVWNYKDSILQSTQAAELPKLVKYKTVLNLEFGNVIQLEKENEQEIIQSNGDFAVIARTVAGDRFWEKEYDDRIFILVSLKDGSRRVLTEKGLIIKFSPDGSYLVFFTRDHQGVYYSYNLRNGKLVNISAGVSEGQFAYKDLYLRLDNKKTPQTIFLLYQMIGWVKENGLLVADNYDIWQLDLDGKRPINLTNGYGLLNQTMFQISGGGDYTMDIYRSSDTLLLKAFNQKNKFSGYYRKRLGAKGNPERLYMGPCFMESFARIGGTGKGMAPLKATDVNIWIVQRQTASEAPNYFITSDFRQYKPLTNLQPQKEYNWLRTELHNFRQLDGTIGQGVLYKPENFDVSKKYPVIVSFYKAFSAQLYQFLAPDYINRPSIFSEPAWMVSHGYLVFLPDIYFIQGNWGLSTRNSIEGAARYLKTLPYVDGDNLGAVGHSNSGRFGYYLLTHSKSFAAFSIGAGVTDVMSTAFSLKSGGNEESNLEGQERTAFGAGGLGSLWENKSLWLDHIAVLQADKVVSPLLLFHNKQDAAIKYAAPMFTALRRLEKKVWWLQYDEGSHTLGKVRDLRDFTIRYTQYFDHYLKGAPAPRWMTKGVGAAMKGVETGYELDPSGNCSLKLKASCKICKKWNEQYTKMPVLFSKTY